MAPFLQRLKERKLAQWALAYLAGAFVVFQLLDALETPLGLTASLQQGILLVVGLGFLVTLVLAWYHGERGRQRVSGPELLIIALLLAIAGGVLSILSGGEQVSESPGTATRAGELDHPLTAIAVLPFQNFSADGPYSFFAGGLHDELLTQLAKVGALKVISRTSVMGYTGTDLPSLRQIASELGVGSVLEGTVQVVGDRLRVHVQLIDAATDDHLWADSYDRTLDDAFAIQSDVAQQVVVAVGARLTSSEEGFLAEPPTANAEAHRLYLQALDYHRRPGSLRQNLEVAQELLERALAVDPDFALAHAELSFIHGELFVWRYDPSPERITRQRQEAETALRLDPNLPEAHGAMGFVHYNRRDWQKALDEFAIGVQAQPSNAEWWGIIGYTHRRLGNWDQVDVAYEQATQLDPWRLDIIWDLRGYTYQLMRHFAEAIAAYDEALALAPDLKVAAVQRGLAYLDWRGELDTLRSVLDQLPPDVADLSHLGTARAQKAQLLLWERKPDTLLALLGNAPDPVFTGGLFFLPTSLYAAWAHEMRGDNGAAQSAFDSARVQLDSSLVALPDEWPLHAARGLALAGLGRREEALEEVRWLRQLFNLNEDGHDGPYAAVERARILAKVGEVDAALDEIEQLLAGPSSLSLHRLRLDPRWDPLRSHPRFQALLER
ncbi:tetratricopeptide repeat protein [Gemmatimonadota bacterium]